MIAKAAKLIGSSRTTQSYPDSIKPIHQVWEQFPRGLIIFIALAISRQQEHYKNKKGFLDAKLWPILLGRKLKDAEWRMEGKGLRVKNGGCRIKSEERRV